MYLHNVNIWNRNSSIKCISIATVKMEDLFTDTSDWSKEQVEFLTTSEFANMSSHINSSNYTLTDAEFNNGWEAFLTTSMSSHTNNSNYTLTDAEFNNGWEAHQMVIIVTFPIIFIIGTIGNLLIFFVMQRGSLKHSSTCFYMAILALADTCKLILSN